MKIDTPDVFELLKSALIAGGYDGLCDGYGCGCLIDDLCPCDCGASLLPELCRAGWKHVDENGNWEIGCEKEEK